MRRYAGFDTKCADYDCSSLQSQNEKRSPRLDEFAPPTFVYIEELRGKTVGILGYGAVRTVPARSPTSKC